MTINENETNKKFKKLTLYGGNHTQNILTLSAFFSGRSLFVLFSVFCPRNIQRFIENDQENEAREDVRVGVK